MGVENVQFNIRSLTYLPQRHHEQFVTGSDGPAEQAVGTS